MTSPDRVTILLADEDALRRDGLSLVLSAVGNFEIVAEMGDGEAALEEIRRLRPDVAVVDLNLPKLHGIELVRRIRAEAPGTKVVVLAGTSDDEIVREVVRAGGDGYLLKNGPARHLIDAISYVRDGGQYFSPQLRRDGRNRHLLEEPPRVFREPSAQTRSPQASDPARFRERIREQAGSGKDLDDRDYEIMTMMADGIRPILDRLDEIDNRVARMEIGDEPVPADPRGWLSTELADSLREPRAGGDVAVLGRTVTDLEARLPALIEEAVTIRFHQMAEKLQEEIEETHVRTLETFVRNIQVKLVQRVSALENDMSKQAEAMNQLREYSQRTEDNLSRLITGVDRLSQELPRRLAAPVSEAPPQEGSSPPRPAKPATRRDSGRSNRAAKVFWLSVGGVLATALLVWLAAGLIGRSGTPGPATTTAGALSPGAASLPGPVAGADTKTRMQAAQEYVDRKDYAMAEDVYKQVIKTEPNNVDALKGLASVLYRQDKIDESAAILDRIPRN